MEGLIPQHTRRPALATRDGDLVGIAGSFAMEVMRHRPEFDLGSLMWWQNSDGNERRSYGFVVACERGRWVAMVAQFHVTCVSRGMGKLATVYAS